MKTIWKVPVNHPRNDLVLPKGAAFLDAQVQGQAGDVQSWWLVETSNDRQIRRVAVYVTGAPLPESPGTHLATVQHSGETVHLFEQPRAPFVNAGAPQ